MKRLAFTFSLWLGSYCCFSQGHYIDNGTKKLKATSPWIFEVEYFPGLGVNNGLTVQIAKAAFGGFLLLSIPANTRYLSIGGPATIHLLDGSVIKCRDKGMKRNAHDVATTLYALSEREMKKMTKSRMANVDFYMIHRSWGRQDGYSGENYIPSDGYGVSTISVETGVIVRPFNTEQEIADLMR